MFKKTDKAVFGTANAARIKREAFLDKIVIAYESGDSTFEYIPDDEEMPNSKNLKLVRNRLIVRIEKFYLDMLTSRFGKQTAKNIMKAYKPIFFKVSLVKEHIYIMLNQVDWKRLESLWDDKTNDPVKKISEDGAKND